MKKLLWLLPIAAIVGLDQLTKYLVVKNLELHKSITIINGVLNFTRTGNDGAVAGILDDHRWVFMSVSTVAIIAMLIFMFGFYKKYYSPLLYTSLSMVVGGGIGNMIDRIALVDVVDFIDVKFIPFWKLIFNVADIFVCVGCALILFYVIKSDIAESRKRKESEQKN